MTGLGPFEPGPEIAVACSGGPDSMALTALAHGWADSLGGRATALIVDHGLRAGSRAEAALTRRRLKASGIEAHILRWQGGKPVRGIQDAAREARYRLLEGWCHRRGVLHLLTAHHRDDQAETVLQRLARASGPLGLAAMPSVRETRGIRLLRPLLGVSRERLQETLAARNLDWVEDPSNRNEDFERVRLRAAMPALTAAGLTAETMAALARRYGQERGDLERGAASALARHGTLFEEGYAILTRSFFADCGRREGMGAFDRLLCAIGGRRYPTRREALDALYRSLAYGSFSGGRTLSGCVVRDYSGDILVAREAGRILAADIAEGQSLLWDGRYRVRLKASAGTGRPRRFTLAALDRQLLAETGDEAARARAALLPAPVRRSLPALYDRQGLVAVPHLGYGRVTRNAGRVPGNLEIFPSRPVTEAVFSVA